MTNADLNSKCAEIMGYKFDDAGFTLKPHPLIHREDYNPCENIGQAFEVAEKVYYMSIQKMQAGWWRVWVLNKNETSAEVNEESLPLAIVRACVAAFEKENKS